MLLSAAIPRRWHPRTPADCPACRAHEHDPPPGGRPPSPPPWRERQGRRGAPKRVATAGYACPTRGRPYHGITDERIPAPVGSGHHGVRAHILDFRCQACGTDVSARWGTARYGLETPAERVGEGLGTLAEGVDVAAAVRVFGHGAGTIAGRLARAGRHADRVPARALRGLHPPHPQPDEIRTRLRSRRAVLRRWRALDPLTERVPVVYLGPRTRASAHAVIHALRDRLAPGCVPRVASDGLRRYHDAPTAHFDRWVATCRRRAWRVAETSVSGRVEKLYRRRGLIRVAYCVAADSGEQRRAALRAPGLRGRLNTAFVERANPTLRQGVPALGRRTWSTAPTTSGWREQVAWRLALPVPHGRGGRREPRRYRLRTPAMATGLTRRRWSARELLRAPCSFDS